MSTVEQVLRFKQALRVAQTGESLDEPQITHSTNRGHKLERGARFVSSNTLVVPSLDESDDSMDEDKDLDSTEQDLNIDVAKLLQPISDPAEVSSHPAIKHIFMNPFLKQLSSELLGELVDDKTVLAEIVKLLGALIGDDDLNLMPQIMAKLEEPEPYPTPEPGKPLPPVKEDPQLFFQAPQLESDSDHGLSPEEAQDLREKLQVVQQQMEEYIRCMTQVRMDLTRTQRLRRNVLNWCREMNNEDYVKADLDEQNNADNAGLGEQPAKDMYQNGSANGTQSAAPEASDN